MMQGATESDANVVGVGPDEQQCPLPSDESGSPYIDDLG